MMTLCLGGPMDGKLVKDEERERFYVLDCGPDPLMLRSQMYRRERFGWGPDSMWVYLHEFVSERQAMLDLFGARDAVNGTGTTNER